jgi:hypothetical protein
MNTFEEILLLPGTAVILADKLSGRIIGRIADGFDKDPALYDMMCLFRALEDKWPDSVMSLRAMYDLQMEDAAKDSSASDEAMEGLTPEQRELWLKEPIKASKKDRLQQALPTIIDLHTRATPDSGSWEDLTTINQWSLLNAVEKGLHQRLKRYKVWAKEDEDNGKTESRAITLRDDAQEDVEPLAELITAFLADSAVVQDLEQDVSNGIRVPVRFIAA